MPGIGGGCMCGMGGGCIPGIAGGVQAGGAAGGAPACKSRRAEPEITRVNSPGPEAAGAGGMEGGIPAGDAI
jgi:hypothetical protein